MKQLKRISLSKVSGFLTDPEMKKVTGGYGDDGDCCRYTCWITLDCSKSDTLNISQSACWDVMDSMCDYGFSIQPC